MADSDGVSLYSTPTYINSVKSLLTLKQIKTVIWHNINFEQIDNCFSGIRRREGVDFQPTIESSVADNSSLIHYCQHNNMNSFPKGLVELSRGSTQYMPADHITDEH